LGYIGAVWCECGVEWYGKVLVQSGVVRKSVGAVRKSVGAAGKSVGAVRIGVAKAGAVVH